MPGNPQTTTRFLDEHGNDIQGDEIEKDMSNVFAIVRTESMTVAEFKRRFLEELA